MKTSGIRMITLAIIMAVLVVLLIYGIGHAEGNSTTLRVSCTIPAIPGINAPPFNVEEQTQPATVEANKEEAAISQAENQDPKSDKILIAKEEKADSTINTIYSR